MTRTHVEIIEAEDGEHIFIRCFFCMAMVGPLPKDMVGQVQIPHDTDCVFINAAMLNRQLNEGKSH